MDIEFLKKNINLILTATRARKVLVDDRADRECAGIKITDTKSELVHNKGYLTYDVDEDFPFVCVSKESKPISENTLGRRLLPLFDLDVEIDYCDDKWQAIRQLRNAIENKEMMHLSSLIDSSCSCCFNEKIKTDREFSFVKKFKGFLPKEAVFYMTILTDFNKFDFGNLDADYHNGTVTYKGITFINFDYDNRTFVLPDPDYLGVLATFRKPEIEITSDKIKMTERIGMGIMCPDNVFELEFE